MIRCFECSGLRTFGGSAHVGCSPRRIMDEAPALMPDDCDKFKAGEPVRVNQFLWYAGSDPSQIRDMEAAK
jgi:hypothetical protein